MKQTIRGDGGDGDGPQNNTSRRFQKRAGGKKSMVVHDIGYSYQHQLSLTNIKFTTVFLFSLAINSSSIHSYCISFMHILSLYFCS